MIYVGTSGFSFEDWKGNIYPENLRKSQMLGYYWNVLGLNAVELNFTYYSIPSYRTMVSLLRKTPPWFVFTVKIPGSITHEGWKSSLDRSEIEKYLNSVKPMMEEGRLKLHLAQFPYSFKYSCDHLDYIRRISDRIKPLAIEFRHDSWNRPETYEFLSYNGITYVVVDEPKIARLFPYVPKFTTDTAYFRFHGRSEKWFEAEGGERYDYLYSEEELSAFAKDVKEISKKVKNTFVFFNNCHEGKAAKNAKTFKEMIG